MNSSTGLQGKQPLDDTPIATHSEQSVKHTRRIVGFTLWLIGFVLLVVSSVIVHFHPGPWPIDVQTTITLQHLHISGTLSTLIAFFSIVDDPRPATVIPIIWFLALVLVGLFVRFRGRSPMRLFVTAIFISVGAALAAGLNLLFSTLVHRPRPTSVLIHIYRTAPTGSFPSGHVENDVVFLGFLLYLSFSQPISQWRYRWVLIPFQVYAIVNILLIGYSRIYEGSHWLTDVSGGYFSGALWLFALIFLYRWVVDKLIERRARKIKE